MINRWMAVVLGAAVLAVPSTALAKGDHAKGKGHEKTHKVEKHAKKHGKKDKSAKKAKSYVFKGVYKGEGVVTVASGNSRVRKGGYVGKDVTFDLASAKIVAAELLGEVARAHAGRLLDRAQGRVRPRPVAARLVEPREPGCAARGVSEEAREPAVSGRVLGGRAGSSDRVAQQRPPGAGGARKDRRAAGEDGPELVNRALDPPDAGADRAQARDQGR